MSKPSPGEITEVLNRIKQGDKSAEGQLAQLVYPMLKRIASSLMQSERAGHQMRPSDLLQEAFLRLFVTDKSDLKDRKHFYNTAALIMRHVLVDHARREYSGGRTMLSIEEFKGLQINRDENILELNEALIKLEAVFPDLATIVTLQYFGGLRQPEIAEIMGISVANLKRRLGMAKAFLKNEMSIDYDTE